MAIKLYNTLTGRKEVFYMYTVAIDEFQKDVVLHEDEIQLSFD